MKEHRHWKMKAGEKDFAAEPMISFVPGGERAYIWVGNDAKGDKRCYATLGGAAALRVLAHAILKEVGEVQR